VSFITQPNAKGFSHLISVNLFYWGIWLFGVDKDVSPVQAYWHDGFFSKSKAPNPTKTQQYCRVIGLRRQPYQTVDTSIQAGSRGLNHAPQIIFATKMRSRSAHNRAR
jgi:hypothetical protein